MDTTDLVLIVFLYFLPGIQDSRQELISELACERFPLNINCESGQVIKIHNAGYGREAGKDICPPERRDCPWAPNSLEKVKQRCQARQTCKVFAANNVFGDPCVGIVKYLQVNYSCEYPTCKNFGSECSRSEGEVCKDMDGAFQCVCMDTYELSEGNCMVASTQSIQSLYQMDITEANAESVAVDLASALTTSNTSTAEELTLAVDVFRRIVKQDVFSNKVTTSLVVSTNALSMFGEDVIDQVPEVGQIPLLLEQYVVDIHESALEFSTTLENVGVLATKIRPAEYQDDVTFASVYAGSSRLPSNLSESYTGLFNGGTDMLDNATSGISIPASVLKQVSQDGQTNTVPLTFLIYKDNALFPLGNTTDKTTKEIIGSQVISAAVGPNDATMNNLPENQRVTIKFRLSLEYKSGLLLERQCVYWRYSDVTNLTEWATDGCTEVTGQKGSDVICSCNHLTSFAVLMRLQADGEYSTHHAFDVISNIGCIVSIVGLGICVIVSLTIKSMREKQLTQIHVNLSISLIAFYTTFLVGIDATNRSETCKIIASLIQFFCLSSMAWMSVEALNMFLLLWLRRRSGMKALVPIGVVLAWGIPFLISMLTYWLSSTDAHLPTNYCFLQPGLGLYIGFLLPMFLMFLFNATVFLLISYRVACRNIFISNAEARRKAELARIKGPILFGILLGMSWIFGFSAAVTQGVLRVVLECMFSLFLGLQGFLMFYVITVNNPDVCEKISKMKVSAGRLGAKKTKGDSVVTEASTSKLKSISTMSKDVDD